MVTQKVITFISRWISPGLLVAGALACGSGPAPEPASEAGDWTPSVAIPTLAAGGDQVLEASPEERVLNEFDKLRERRERSLQTIEAIPEPTPPPTADPAVLAAAQVLGGGGVAAASNDDGLIPEPRDGIWWYRDSPGDWTDSATRERNPYLPLFEAMSLESKHPSFAYGGMQEAIARMLAEEAEVLMPELRGHGPQLVDPLKRNMGWEIVGDELPVARVWSSFTYFGPLDSKPRRYRMGGVMLFDVREYLEANTGDLIYQYLDVGYFLGSGVLMEDEGYLDDGG